MKNSGSKTVSGCNTDQGQADKRRDVRVPVGWTWLVRHVLIIYIADPVPWLKNGHSEAFMCLRRRRNHALFIYGDYLFMTA